MAIGDLLNGPEGRAFIGEVARTYGIPAETAAAAVGALLPELVNGLERNTLSRGGIAELLESLATGDHERYLGAQSILGDQAIMGDGARILGHLFSSESSARRAIRFVEGETGVSRSILWQILPGVAALLVGWLARQAKGGLGDVLKKLPGGAAVPDAGGSRPSYPRTSGRWPGPDLGGGTLPKTGGDIFPPPPDLGRLPRTNSGPYGDLSDILRKGGGGGGLASIIRNILGGLLGFRSKGIVGWIIRFLLVRYGWRILSYVVRRVLLGR